MKQDPENEILKDDLTGDKLIQGHEYDGIKELDNKLPKWWLGLFYITIIFAIVYLLRFHVLKTSPLQEEEYLKEMAMVEKTGHEAMQQGGTEPAALTMMTDTDNLTAGKEIYDKNCLVCHLSKGEGLVGPNLTDAYWIHGGSFDNIVNTIIVGVPAKGMISWKDMLSSLQIQQVASYIVSLQGTNPPNAKAPEGELYSPGT
jgi:cytochrome c oxidase cbb3-type subunit 3